MNALKNGQIPKSGSHGQNGVCLVESDSLKYVPIKTRDLYVIQ